MTFLWDSLLRSLHVRWTGVLMRVSLRLTALVRLWCCVCSPGKARGQTPQQRGTYFLRRRCEDALIGLLAVAHIAGVRKVVLTICA